MCNPVSILQRVLAGFLVAIMCIALCFTAGCAKSEAPKPSGGTDDATSQAQPTPQDKIAQSFTSENLMGIWLGNATLDEAKLRRKLQPLTSERQQLAIAKATSFLSTVMAVEYKHDGTLENDLELMSIDGKVLRDGSTGFWRVVEPKVDGLVIETQETLSDGSIATSQSYLKFFAEGNRFVAAVPIGEDLQGCDAMLVFERQTLPDANLAEGNLETQNK